MSESFVFAEARKSFGMNGLMLLEARKWGGFSNRVPRLTALGNGQVPAAAALAWMMLAEGACDA